METENHNGTVSAGAGSPFGEFESCLIPNLVQKWRRNRGLRNGAIACHLDGGAWRGHDFDILSESRLLWIQFCQLFCQLLLKIESNSLKI